MLDDRGFELKVGIFVFIGIIILFIIVFSIGKIYLFQPGYRIKVVFNFAGGLSDAAPVRLAGVEVGEIDTIDIYFDEEAKRTRVETLAWIRKDVAIEKNSIARVNTLGMLGEKYLEIIPGSRESGVMEEGDMLIGEDPIMMDELAEDLRDLSDSAGVIMGRLERGEGAIGKLLTEEKIYNDLEAFVEDLKRNPWKLFRKTSDKKARRKKRGSSTQ
jgi:phospholipid/cholesterol/gamma-HCH transport system substrate-binding protein